jgi:hypothetical protein
MRFKYILLDIARSGDAIRFQSNSLRTIRAVARAIPLAGYRMLQYGDFDIPRHRDKRYRDGWRYDTEAARFKSHCRMVDEWHS